VSQPCHRPAEPGGYGRFLCRTGVMVAPVVLGMSNILLMIAGGAGAGLQA